MALSASVRRSAAKATLTLPFRIPLKDAFTIREVAELCGMKETFVEERFDAGVDLAGFKFPGTTGKRHSKRIPYAWAVAFYVKHATWDDESIADAYVACLSHFPTPTLLRIAETSRRLAAEKPLQPR